MFFLLHFDVFNRILDMLNYKNYIRLYIKVLNNFWLISN